MLYLMCLRKTNNWQDLILIMIFNFFFVKNLYALENKIILKIEIEIKLKKNLWQISLKILLVN